jgi:hypothetical protein
MTHSPETATQEIQAQKPLKHSLEAIHIVQKPLKHNLEAIHTVLTATHVVWKEIQRAQKTLKHSLEAIYILGFQKLCIPQTPTQIV